MKEAAESRNGRMRGWEDGRMGRADTRHSILVTRCSSLDAGLINCKKQDTRNKVSGIVIARNSFFYRHREEQSDVAISKDEIAALRSQ
jgi:hypothetical protein